MIEKMGHHLSYPQGQSVNDGIPIEASSVHYASIGDAIDALRHLGQYCFLAKTDIKNAFRLLPIKTLSIPLVRQI